jgi:hypothetical protein
MKSPWLGEWLIWIGTLLVLVWIVWMVTGCALQKKAVITVEYTKGCHIAVKGANVESAGKMVENV